MNFKGDVIIYLTFIFLELMTTTASNIKRDTHVLVPVNRKVNNLTFYWTDRLIEKWHGVVNNNPVDFGLFNNALSEIRFALRNGTEDIRKGQLREANILEAKQVMSLREDFYKRAQGLTQVLKIAKYGQAVSSFWYTRVSSTLAEHLNSSKEFAEVVVNKMPGQYGKDLSKLEDAASRSLKGAIDLFECRQGIRHNNVLACDRCRNGGFVEACKCYWYRESTKLC